MPRKNTPDVWEFTAIRIPDIAAGFRDASGYWYEVTAHKDLPGLWHGHPAAIEHRVRVRLGREPNGRLVCTGLIVGGQDPVLQVEVEIQARTLREIPLSQILSFVARARADDLEAAKFFEVGIVPFDQPKLRPGPKGYPDQFYKDIANLYRAALEREPRSPVKAVMETINANQPRKQHVSYATVRRWIERGGGFGEYKRRSHE